MKTSQNLTFQNILKSSRIKFLPATNIETIARAFAAADPNVTEFTSIDNEQYPTQPCNLRSYGNAPIDVNYHPDMWAERVLVQVRNAECEQAIDRIRLIYNKEIKQIYILTPTVLNITINNIIKWSDFKTGGTRAIRAFNLGKLFPLSRLDL